MSIPTRRSWGFGSPTKVKKIENVVFQAKESKRLTAADADIESLMVELIASHTLG